MHYWWAKRLVVYLCVKILKSFSINGCAKRKDRNHIKSKIEQQERERTTVNSLAVLLTMSWNKKRKLFRYYVCINSSSRSRYRYFCFAH